VTYAGTARDLVAAGCATAELLVAPCATWTGKVRRDADGDRVRVEFRKGWLRIGMHISIDKALQMPGITLAVIREAKDIHGRHVPYLAQYPDLGAYGFPNSNDRKREIARPRPYLRLVVDNTAGENAHV
jgi:hypothetical protein